jgi:transcriptional regulator with XRE-family HTH domain
MSNHMNGFHGRNIALDGAAHAVPSLPGQQSTQDMLTRLRQPAPLIREPAQSDAALGREIRELRRGLGWTQKTLAAMVGVTGAQLHRYETGATRMAAGRLVAIAEALGVAPDSLIGTYRGAGAGAMQRRPAPAHMESGDDLLALVEVFSRITDQKNRDAVVAIARILANTASEPQEGG